MSSVRRASLLRFIAAKEHWTFKPRPYPHPTAEENEGKERWSNIVLLSCPESASIPHGDSLCAQEGLLSPLMAQSYWTLLNNGATWHLINHLSDLCLGCRLKEQIREQLGGASFRLFSSSCSAGRKVVDRNTSITIWHVAILHFPPPVFSFLSVKFQVEEDAPRTKEKRCFFAIFPLSQLCPRASIAWPALSFTFFPYYLTHTNAHVLQGLWLCTVRSTSVSARK